MEDLIKDKLDLITNSYDDFIDEVQNLENKTLEEILTFLKSFIDKPKGTTLSKINKKLRELLSSKQFVTPLRKYLKNFDQVEIISKKILGNELGEDLSDFDLSDEKKLAIEDISRGLLSQDMIDANLQSPIKKILYRYSTTNITLRQAEDELREFITKTDTAGFAERYVRTLAIESLHRFDGSINQRIATDLTLDGFRIVGSLIVTSEPQCRHMIKETGDFAQYAVNGKYRMSDLPAIIEILKSKYKGVYKGLNVSNYFTYRNHWGCRHQFIPTRLLEKDLG